MATTARWGSRIDLRQGGGELYDRHGECIVRIDGARLWLRGAPGRELTVEPAPGRARDAGGGRLGRVGGERAAGHGADADASADADADADAEHPVFGRRLQLCSEGQRCSWMGEVSWSAPASIPPIADPARLPPLTGTMLLNTLACCAAAAGIAELRYVGPYPTPALFASLQQCFLPLGSEADFTAAAAELLLAPRMIAAPVAFRPAPFERWWLAPALGAIGAIGVQAREHIERVFLEGASFERSPTAMRRLVERQAGDASGAPAAPYLAAELWFGDTRWATLAELALDGTWHRGPFSLPRVDDPIVGQELPLPLRRALATLIADAVPAPLAPFVSPLLERATIRWGDAGTAALRASATDATSVTLHAALWITLRPHGPARLALALAEALTPWVIATAVRQ